MSFRLRIFTCACVSLIQITLMNDFSLFQGLAKVHFLEVTAFIAFVNLTRPHDLVVGVLDKFIPVG